MNGFKYGSFWHIASILVTLGIAAGLFFIFRKRSMRTKRIVVGAVMGINLVQHLLKWLIWPHLYGRGFGLDNTAYNMCAFLIISSPLILICGSSLWKNFITYVGSTAGLIAIVVPFWFQGGTVFSWEYLRFFVCHALLFASSLLPALFGIYKIDYRKFWKIGFVFFTALILIIFNNMAWWVLSGSKQDLFAFLSAHDPCFVMGPPEQFPIFEKVCRVFSPSVFMGGEGKAYVPVLWYAIPMYFLITALSFAIGAAADRKNFLADIGKLKAKFVKPKNGDNA